MTDESGRFVDDQQAGVFVEDVEPVFQTRGDFNHETHETHEIITTDEERKTENREPKRETPDNKETRKAEVINRETQR